MEDESERLPVAASRSDVESSSVIHHRNLLELNVLLCGPAPEIYSARDRARHPIVTPPEPQSARSPRFAGPPEWAPGRVPYLDRPDASARTLTKQSRLISEVRQAEEYTQSLSDKLDVYGRANQIKGVVHERDFEDHFCVPLQRRIKNQMVGRNYQNFLAQKEMLIHKMDARPVPIRSPRPPHAVPRIEVSDRGLHDPKNRFIEHQAIEERLDRVINRANGIFIPEKKPLTTKTLDYKRFAVLAQTKFFFGNDPDRPFHAGVKCFPGTATSRVPRVMDWFD
jgi:hypothetical protein